MNSFQYYTPTKVVFGSDTHHQVGKLVKEQNCRKVLLHFGGGSARRSGLLDAIEASLKAEGIEYVTLGGVVPNPRLSLVYEGVELCKQEQVDFILAVGGGSVIDSAKAIGYGVANDGDVWDLYDRKRHASDCLPIGVVLTIAAAGSEGSGDSVITKEDGMEKRGAGSDLLRPRFSILNPELTFTLPPYQTACGATDIMAHVFERYFTNTKEVEITDRLCEAVLMTLVKETPRVIADPENYEARANIMWAGTVAHTNIVGVGRSQDWNSHGIEHELSGMYDVAHGAGLAVIMPAWMEFVYKHDVMRFAQMAVRVFGCQMNFENPEATALEGIKRFRRFLHDIGMPINFKELGAREEDIPTLARNMGIKDKTWGFVRLSEEDVRAIYTIAAKAEL